MSRRRPLESGFAQAVGARLRELRQARKVSQQRLADAAGLSQGSISNYEYGVRDIAVVSLLAILDYMEVSVGEFFAGVPALLVLRESEDVDIARALIAEG